MRCRDASWDADASIASTDSDYNPPLLSSSSPSFSTVPSTKTTAPHDETLNYRKLFALSVDTPSFFPSAMSDSAAPSDKEHDDDPQLVRMLAAAVPFVHCRMSAVVVDLLMGALDSVSWCATEKKKAAPHMDWWPVRWTRVWLLLLLYLCVAD